MKNYNRTIPVEPLFFETVFTAGAVRNFFCTYWHYSIYISIFYILAIKILQRYMKDRPPYNFNRAFTIWNGILAVYSICSSIRLIPILFEQFKHFTFYEILCNKSIVDNTSPLLFWATLFAFSKVWELGDTIMIILHKRKLMFLHCYHHPTMLIMSWYASYKRSTYLMMIVYTNLYVHSLMYTYFTVKCMSIKISSTIAMFITATQVTQMWFALLLTCWMYWLLLNEQPCDTSFEILKFVFVVALSYLYLFTQLFYKSYICRSKVYEKKDKTQ
ncbi:putative fatty acid elongation protein 4 [Centruroides sculpturatus]|uniref:putative fatty acid elongation protein 4 n=1 Tax=Centruroides sculpturatus TaxID=218467 RepID=UPI000C6CA874|nr:putative fatty acid elongation protein 4 [Centruroides sculpturatus]